LTQTKEVYEEVPSPFRGVYLSIHFPCDGDYRDSCGLCRRDPAKGTSFPGRSSGDDEADPSHPTSVYVVLQDYEQESCFVLLV
jgi:hypothetical protein